MSDGCFWALVFVGVLFFVLLLGWLVVLGALRPDL